MYSNNFIISTIDTSTDRQLDPSVDYIKNYKHGNLNSPEGHWGYTLNIEEAQIFDDMIIGNRIKDWHDEFEWIHHEVLFIYLYSIEEIISNLLSI